MHKQKDCVLALHYNDCLIKIAFLNIKDMLYVSYVEQTKLINKSDDLPRRSCMFSRFLVQFSIKLNDSMKTTKQKKQELLHWLTFSLIAVNMYFIIYSPFTVTIQ